MKQLDELSDLRYIPDVSIIVTCHNYAQYLPRCLRSCLNQRNIIHEVIVVNDDSNDETETVATELFASRIVYVNTDRNVGVAGASNIGLKIATAQFVIRVDADDYVNADMCHVMKLYLEANHDAFCVSCDYFVVDEYENVQKRMYAETDPISCGIMYRRDLLVKNGGYNDQFRHREEEEMRKRLGELYKIHHLRIPFYRYRMHSANKTKTKEYLETKI